MSSHPFLLCSERPPNDGQPVTSIEQLKDKEVEDQELAFAKSLPASKYSFVINFKHTSTAESPITNDWSFVDMARRYPPPTWEQLFFSQIQELANVENLLSIFDKEDLYPERRRTFEAFYQCPLQKLKVVIIGQDPYPGISRRTKQPMACGMSFSSHRGCEIPPSLRALFDEINSSLGVGMGKHPDLRKWARQGVLLLNTELTFNRTTRKQKPSNDWQDFLSGTLKYIQDKRPKCLYLLMGGFAHKLVTGNRPYITDGPRVIKVGHPSPNNRDPRTRFKGCGAFVTINQQLQTDGEKPIDWYIGEDD